MDDDHAGSVCSRWDIAGQENQPNTLTASSCIQQTCDRSRNTTNTEGQVGPGGKLWQM